ncbi:TPR repeat-containing protein YrrB [compost metagenome]
MNLQNNAQLIKLAEHYFRSGNYPVAENFLKQILASNPADPKANELLAYIAGNTGNTELARKLLHRASQHPDCSAEALYYLGTSFLSNNQFQEATVYFEKSIKNGDFFEALHDLGLAYFHLEKYAESIETFKKALFLRPNSFEALTNLGNSLKKIKQNEEALVYQSKAVEADPSRAEGWLNKGVILTELRRYSEAVAQYDQAIQLKPDYLEAWSNKGNVLHTLKRFNEALAHHEQAVQISNSDAETLFNKGITLHELKRYEEALAHHLLANELNPDLDYLLGTLIHEKMIIGAWDNIESEISEFANKLSIAKKLTNPFNVLSVIDSPHLHLLIAKDWVKEGCPINYALPDIPKYTNKKIRIGYFSADFKDHPVSALTAELFELHNRDRFEIFAFSLHSVPADDHVRARLIKAFDHFIDVDDFSDLQITELARKHQIDIAVDLGGHTQGARPGIFAYRAAPIQVNYLGFPGTLGAEYMDYIIADQTIIPKDKQLYYSEKIAYLPDTYMVNDSKREPTKKPLTKSEFNLPETGFIFCCFNNSYKINPPTFQNWMRILEKVDGSVLWLSENNAAFQKNLRSEAEKRGICPDRLIFAKRVADPSIHLARHMLADLFLDARPYNAHTTAVDALLAGLPVLTLIGESFASRVAASLLNAVGLPELITHTEEEYETLAIDLATSPEKVIALKQKLTQNHSKTALFDTKLFTRNIERTYQIMYERHQAGLVPDHIDATSSFSHA